MDLEPESCDAVALVNMLHLTSVKPLELLKTAYHSLVPGGVVIVSGPTSAESFRASEELIAKHLADDGMLEKFEGHLDILRKLTEQVLSGRKGCAELQYDKSDNTGVSHATTNY